MRKKITMVLIALILLGCKKNPFDYRTQYTGDYIFKIHSTSGSPLGSQDTLYSDNGNISYGSDWNKIKISHGGYSSEYIVYEDGTIEGNGCEGSFESSNRIRYSCHWASPAAHADAYVIGERKK